MALHSLVSQRRVVPAERRAGYDERWAELHRAATALGVHAWRFASATEEGVFLEFLEFHADAPDPRADPAVEAALSALRTRVGEAVVEEWAETVLSVE